MESPPRPLEMIFVPHLTPSHMIPLFETGRLFAARGQHVTVVTTPSNAHALQPTIDTDTAAGHRISLHTIPFPSKEVGLPDGLENFMGVDFETTIKLFRGYSLLRPKIEEFITTRRPDCIVTDMFFYWTVDLADRLGIPRLHYHTASVFTMCVEHASRSPDSPHWKLQSDYEPFVIPNLPDPISMTRSQLPDYARDLTTYSSRMVDNFKEAELKSYAVLTNSFYELDSAYAEHYNKTTGGRVFSIGPTCLIHRNKQEKVERVYKTVVGENELLSWLDSKEPNSVLYVSFGTACILPDDQLMEIAGGLENSDHNFIWVVQGKDKNEEEEEQKWLPKGFRERIIGRGMIVKGWAPQMLILDHSSVGGFVTHCGWNSLSEFVCAGIPVITWPLHAEQFYNEKLVTQVLGIGVEVGVEDWSMQWLEAGKKVIKSEKIEKAVRKLMDGDDGVARLMRQKAKELGEQVKRAVNEGGSSHRNLTILVEELKSLVSSKDQKTRS